MKIEFVILSANEAERQRLPNRPPIRVRLLDMTHERKCYLFEELRCEDGKRLDALVFDIERVLHMFLYHKGILTRDGGLDLFDSGTAKKTFAEISRHLNAVYALMSTLDDRSLEFLVPESEPFDDEDAEGFHIETFHSDVRLVGIKAGLIANEIEPTRGRPARDDLLEAVVDLAAVYEHVASGKAGYSSRPEKKPGAGGLEVHGPFVRFVQRVFSITDALGIPIRQAPESTIDNAVRRYIDSRNHKARPRTAAVQKILD
ncbi:hypothetical protein OEG84_02335 [Hoeflea sp. G2-23]|uniref:Uncharacterized protein n=1 Tax=Hoeflea algicola TaxID=2983763 RepID=A0ABT3Z493_9HYPH|nr:hypothetical protein [Hoeflea algicola]MCY0146585.1 hypothetical protein [Hoeflea algicola]